ncbi:MBL fold metallo-hydrolase [Oscillatoria laete-virens NRMC-F 0139]|nr:MBL fold metallo-hydrolase [Oscillatoria laete-virens]MDL5054627.1 MBL fold metallo-hydrolase [Oscillatoria laete-virens NRMC-F 0139]
MKITFLGAAGEVTGSCHLVETAQARLLVDCGLFHGRDFLKRNVLPAQIAPGRLDAVVLTHAHLDHTGRLPLLAKAGFHGVIHATPATIEMAALVLRDSAHVQAQDMIRINRKRAGEEPLEPLYSDRDVEAILALMRPVDYRTPAQIAPGVTIRMREAGHMLGSASVEIRAEGKTAVFSGDIGPRGAAILRDPEPFECADAVILESTYGDRDHKPLPDTLTEFEQIVRDTIAHQGKIMVPSFAIGRTQQILYHLGEFFREGRIKPFPIYIDSPMAIEATNIYQHHPELFDEESRRLIHSGAWDSLFEHVHMSRTSDDSKAINSVKGPCLIMAGAGMCNAGRILHHLKYNLWNPQNAVVIVGYQADGSLGRQLVDGKKEVSIHGDRVAVKSTIHTLGGFSAHAGQSELLEWFAKTLPCKPRVILNHGEDKSREPLAVEINRRFQVQATRPVMGESFSL